MKFEEQFPNLIKTHSCLIDENNDLITNIKVIQKYCLDKQKVKEAIEKIGNKYAKSYGVVNNPHTWEMYDLLVELDIDINKETLNEKTK